jgi:anti-sigma regulatory factor (Ser/Thr protein kinase)
LFYRDLDEYLAGVGGFAQDGVHAGEPVLLALPGERLAAVAERLSQVPGEIRMLDMAAVGRNPGRIMTELTDFADRPGPVRIVGEPIWAARSAAETREATRHEALINLMFAGVPTTILCPYDVSNLPAHVLADVERTHPVLWEKGQERRSASYTDPLVLDAACQAPVSDDADEFLLLTIDTLATVRHRVQTFAEEGGLTGSRLQDMVLAADEAASNAIRHGGGEGTVMLWHRPDAVVIEIRDHGVLADPLVGRRRPSPDVPGGRGVWLMHQLCDLVEFRPGAVRLTITVS